MRLYSCHISPNEHIRRLHCFVVCFSYVYISSLLGRMMKEFDGIADGHCRRWSLFYQQENTQTVSLSECSSPQILYTKFHKNPPCFGLIWLWQLGHRMNVCMSVGCAQTFHRLESVVENVFHAKSTVRQAATTIMHSDSYAIQPFAPLAFFKVSSSIVLSSLVFHKSKLNNGILWCGLK